MENFTQTYLDIKGDLLAPVTKNSEAWQRLGIVQMGFHVRFSTVFSILPSFTWSFVSRGGRKVATIAQGHTFMNNNILRKSQTWSLFWVFLPRMRKCLSQQIFFFFYLCPSWIICHFQTDSFNQRRSYSSWVGIRFPWSCTWKR